MPPIAERPVPRAIREPRRLEPRSRKPRGPDGASSRRALIVIKCQFGGRKQIKATAYHVAFTRFLSASTIGRYLSQSFFQPSAFFLACSIAASETFMIGVRAGPGFTYPANSMASLEVLPSLSRSPPVALIISAMTRSASWPFPDLTRFRR